MRSLVLALVAATVVATAGNDDAWAADTGDRLPVTRVQDLHYGDVLFHFFQDENFEALTRLLAYGHWDRLPHHLAEAGLPASGARDHPQA